jgi:S1-C subfamily serine protease
MLKEKIICLAVISVLLLSPLNALSADEKTPTPQTFPQIVCIQGSTPMGMLEGSGFVIAPGYILTSFHGLDKAKKLTVQFEKGSRYPAAVFSVSAELDLALLSFPNKKAPFLSFAKGENVLIGTPIFTVGCPFGLHHSMTRGIVSAEERIIRERRVFQTDMAINPGNSGGPVLNQKGQVVGVVLGILQQARGISFALPSREAIRFLGETFSQMGTLFFDAKRDADAVMAYTQAIRFSSRGQDIADLTNKRHRALQRGNQ